MFQLKGLQVLQMLQKSLRKCLPESLKVYGTVLNMNQGNPFNLKALVDKWPDFTTVVVRPQEQEMTDNFDHYTNTYQIYSKDPSNCQEFLGTSDVINWRQHLQIQSTQSSLDEAIQNLTTIKLIKVEQVQCIIYMSPITIRKLLPSLPEANNLPLKFGRPKAINNEKFKLSSLDVTHAALVNKFWHFGGNERSHRFIERCIKNFPSFCVLGPEGTPVSWTLMDQTAEMRMAFTMPEYQNQGLISSIIFAVTKNLSPLSYPIYFHTDEANIRMQKACQNQFVILMPCDWNQWKCEPL
ncbi:glycine N-phenylacetyltransferase-like [Saccopteryx leptura]|uniref:glycine N-phenylacetyltransferase-like n=1 Tax=Saccopteryx leptura TaxID=249018 RepID=UPI00339CEF20